MTLKVKEGVKPFVAQSKSHYERRSDLDEDEFSKYHYGVKRGDIVGIIGFPVEGSGETGASDGFYSHEFSGDFGARLLDLHAMDDTELLIEVKKGMWVFFSTFFCCCSPIM